MRKGKRLLGSLLVLSLLMTMMMGTTVFAQENENVQTEEVAVETEIASVSSTVVGPDGNVYTYLGTATRSGAYNYPVDVLLSRTVTASEGFKLAFYCPNNNGRDLIQGTVTATPTIGGGTVQTFSFINRYNEVSIIDLSQLSGMGRYRLSIKVYAIGTSNQGAVYYRLYQ